MTHSVTEKGWQPEKTVTFGNKFMTGNGYVGIRGTLDEATKKELCALNLAGLYDQVGNKWREPVNAPNPFYTKCTVNGLVCDVNQSAPVTHEQTLDVLVAEQQRQSIFSSGERTVTISSRRIASAADVHQLALIYEIQSNLSGQVELLTGIDGDVWDINGPHLENFLTTPGGTITLTCTTHELKKEVALAEKIVLSVPYEETFEQTDNQVFRKLGFTIEAGHTIQLVKVIQLYTENDVDQPLETAKNELAKITAVNWPDIFSAHQKVWQKRWDEADVTIVGDPEADFALRYSLFQLQIIAPFHREGLSIPARGLSGQTYKGAIFWDTEMFMLPFFSAQNQRLVKNILAYRVACLPEARKKAESYGYRGAFFAWESQEKGQDATSDYNVIDVFTKRPMRTFFKDKQIHISGDITFAIARYFELTQDWAFMLNGGIDVAVESARFYASYATYSPYKKRYELNDVLGPDEYHERVNNNVYTSKIAAFTLHFAIKMLAEIEKKDPKTFAEIKLRLHLADDLDIIQDVAKNLFVPTPAKNNILEQFTGYFKLEDTTPDVIRTRLLNPKEYWGGAYGIASDTQVIKQADVVMMLTLFGEDYSLAEKIANWEYYEPRTEHGSSLSACVYGLLACEIGKSDWAYPFFMKTASVDLTGESKEYAGELYIGGTHPAANGGAWLVAIQGFCGLEFIHGLPVVHSRLPKNWQSVHFNLRLAEKKYAITVTQKNTEIQEIG